MKILVTGGAGFIGSHLCLRLVEEGHEITCVDNLLTGSNLNIKKIKDNENFTFLEHNVIDPFPKSKIRFDIIFHLASPASPNHHSKISYHALPVETMLANTVGTMNILKVAEQDKAVFLFSSSSEVYGDPEQHPQKETYNGNVSTTGPRSVYDEAKRFGETITAYFHRDKKVDTRIARIFNTYGPGMLKSDLRMLVSFISQALEKKPITVFGDGKQTRALCYIDDMVEGLMRFAFSKNTGGEIINLGSTDEHTVLEYAQMVKKLTNSPSEIIFSEKLPQNDPLRRQPDLTKAEKILGWHPKTSLEEGINKMIEYIKKL